MTLPIPKTTLVTMKEGSGGWPVFALQRALNKGFGTGLTEDFDFGPATKAGVEKVQAKLSLTADGIAGPATQGAICRNLAKREENTAAALPDNLLRGQIEGESGGYLAAVAWNTPGGVDCGAVQRRVYDYQYDDEAAIKRAFDAVYQIDLLAKSLLNLHDIFLARPGCHGNSEFAWRLAVLNHNYPGGADKISRVGVSGLSSYWRTAQSWVTAIGARFPDGVAVRTPLEWCQHYSLGNPTHKEPGMMVKLVTTW